MSIIGTKTPDEIKDYSFDWSKDIAGDSIASSGNSSWSVSPSDVTITQSSLGGNGTLTTVWVSGGTIGQAYSIKNTIITAAGRQLTKTFRLLVVSSNFL